MAWIRGKLRDRTDRRNARLPLEWAVEDLNRVLRGWGNLLPLRKLRGQVQSHRRLRQRTPRAPRQRQARTPRPQLARPDSTTNGSASSASIASAEQ
ncbi:MAG: group II intron maturase-specific domain-containing protein [Solirubrobacteraceae bacterium]